MELITDSKDERLKYLPFGLLCDSLRAALEREAALRKDKCDYCNVPLARVGVGHEPTCPIIRAESAEKDLMNCNKQYGLQLETNVKHRKTIETLEKELADARGQVCRARKAYDGMKGSFFCGAYRENYVSSKSLLEMDAAFSPIGPCAHEEEAKRSGGGVSRIMAERIRQKSVEGWTPEHDAQHTTGDLAKAAASYAMNKIDTPDSWCQKASDDLFPPWDESWDKRDKHSRERSLEIAGALVAAELDRLAELRRRAGKG